MCTADTAGLSLRNFQLDTSKLQLHDGPYEISQLSVAKAELVWPSWQDQTLRLSVSGVQLELLQRCMAKVTPTCCVQAAVGMPRLTALLPGTCLGTCASQPRRQAACVGTCAEHVCKVSACVRCCVGMQGVQLPNSPAAAQLAVLDQLLWHRKHSRSGSSTADGGGGGGGSSGFKGWISQLLLKATLGRLDVQLQDCRCQFVVPWLLGPQSQLPEQQARQQYDGVALSMRLLTVTPDSRAPAAGSVPAASPGNVQGASLHEAVGEHCTARPGWASYRDALLRTSWRRSDVLHCNVN